MFKGIYCIRYEVFFHIFHTQILIYQIYICDKHTYSYTDLNFNMISHVMNKITFIIKLWKALYTVDYYDI